MSKIYWGMSPEKVRVASSVSCTWRWLQRRFYCGARKGGSSLTLPAWLCSCCVRFFPRFVRFQRLFDLFDYITSFVLSASSSARCDVHFVFSVASLSQNLRSSVRMCQKRHGEVHASARTCVSESFSSMVPFLPTCLIRDFVAR